MTHALRLVCLVAVFAVLATPVEAGVLYTTTDLGSNFRLQSDTTGQVYGVTGAGGAVYAFDKSPVTSIYEKAQSFSHADSYYVYTMQNGNYKVGYDYDYYPAVGHIFVPTFHTSSPWFTYPGYPPSTIPIP